MNGRLVSLRFIPKPIDGLTSMRQSFGDFLTIVHGENGAGKTPMMKGIMYTLGYPVELTPVVRARCQAIELEIEHDAKTVTVERYTDADFRISVTDSGGGSRVFASEVSASNWFLETFGLPSRRWTGKNGQETIPYLSVIGPGFWIDQDRGWAETYAPLRNKVFVDEQEEEVIRLFFGLPTKRPYEVREEFLAEQRHLMLLDQRIATRREVIARFHSDATDMAPLEAERATIIAKFREVESGIEGLRTTTERFDPLIQVHTSSAEKLRLQMGGLEAQQRKYAGVATQIEGELAILSSNATATEAFREFCGNTSCSLFANSELSFGRRLLYLKDQLKDLTSSGGLIEKEHRKVRERLADEDGRLRVVREERDQTIAASGLQSLTATISVLSRQLADVELRLAKKRQVDRERSAFENTLVEREKVAQRVSELRPTAKRPEERFAEVRRYFAESMARWLKVLRTPNVSGDVVVDERLRVQLDGIRFSEGSFHAGSTRTRIVLSYHAALIETSLVKGGSHPGIVLFDAPRQHELNKADLVDYFRELRTLATKHAGRLQIVISLKEMLVDPLPGDEVWEPRFTGPEGPRYLGSVVPRI